MFLHLALLLLATTRELTGHPDTHVVGGNDVPEGGRPFQVALLNTQDGTTYQFCGGSIVDKEWVLTAAHCLAGTNKDSVTVLSGTTTISKGGTKYKVDKFVIHENYKTFVFDYDIALIKIKDSFSYDDKTSAINIPAEDTPGGLNCILSGWGYINRYEKRTDKMQMVTVKTLTNKECKESKLSRFQERYPLTERQICSYKQEGQGSCQGDSGGPLECNGEVVGITSYNVPCARGFPDVYTRVFDFKDWIASNMK